MVVLTFTNKAANEIKERLAASEEASNLPDMRYFGTFHSVALQLLREVLPVGQLGYTADFQVMDPEEELDLALELIRERKLQIKYKNRLKKRLEQETAGTPGRNSSRIQDDMPLLQEALKEEKKKRDRMSFSDLLFNTEQLLEGTEWKPQWVIIDEVQAVSYTHLSLATGASLRLPNLCGKNIKSWLTFMRAKPSPRTFIISLISLTSFPIPTVFTADRCVPNRICRAWSMSSGCCMHAG